MEPIDNTFGEFLITFKFGGYWREIANNMRRRFEGGKQKTIKLQKDMMNYDVLCKETVAICPWLKGSSYELYYHIHGTSPKNYKLVTCDEEVLQMIAHSFGYSRTEVVISTQVVREEGMSSQGREVINFDSILESYQPNEDYSYKDLHVGASFPDSKTFKQLLRSKAILCNFGVKFISSNKTRVIAVCSYKGCPWRIRASVCRDGQSFEVKRLEPKHICPGVNRTGNKQATIAWVAEEVQDLVKKNPNITPKDINNNLESTYAEDYIHEVTTRREQFIVRSSSTNVAQVEGNKERHVVDIEARKCTCNFWQVVGLPCIHVVAFVGMKEHRLWHTYVDDYYHVVRYKMAYDGAISALPGKEQWSIVDDGVQIGVPNSIRPRGRPKKRRFKNFLETNEKKSTSTH